jgi:hypothetical protein
MSASLCAQCAHPIHPDANGRYPPWCSSCGANFTLRAESATPVPALESGVPAAGCPALVAAGPQTRFFPARRVGGWTAAPLLYRVYVTDKDLLFLLLGPEALGSGRSTAAVGGALGVLVAGLFAKKKSASDPVAERAKLLDLADEPVLRGYAEAWGGSFLATAEDVQGLVFDPPSGWAGRRCEAVLRFQHGAEGAVTLQLPTYHAVRLAIAATTRLFGDAVQINLPYGEAVRRACAGHGPS